jgi:hypothetical protein
MMSLKLNTDDEDDNVILLAGIIIVILICCRYDLSYHLQNFSPVTIILLIMVFVVAYASWFALKCLEPCYHKES